MGCLNDPRLLASEGGCGPECDACESWREHQEDRTDAFGVPRGTYTSRLPEPDADAIPTCPGCGKSAHASESDDDDYHEGCRPTDLCTTCGGTGAEPHDDGMDPSEGMSLTRYWHALECAEEVDA